MNVYPTELKITDDHRLLIAWSDGQKRKYAFSQLRKNCPCATCREKRKEAASQPALLPVLSPAETLPLKVEGMKPVGNYAYSIAFSDGHDTGIFTFELLRMLGEESS